MSNAFTLFLVAVFIAFSAMCFWRVVNGSRKGAITVPLFRVGLYLDRDIEPGSFRIGIVATLLIGLVSLGAAVFLTVEFFGGP